MRQTGPDACGTAGNDQWLLELDRYLTAMAGQIVTPDKTGGSEVLLETRMVSTRYTVSFICTGKRLHRFMAVMAQPYPVQFMLGRLDTNGLFRASRKGGLLFYDYLRSENLLADFCRDLTESVGLCRSKLPLWHRMS